jgi:uncharacterized membrane protein YebE (DUF533 family)
MNTSDLLENLLRGGQGAASQQSPGAGAGQGGMGDLGGLLGGLLGGGTRSGGGSPADGGSGGGLGGLLGGLLSGGGLGGVLSGGLGGGLGGNTGNSGQTRSGGSQYAVLASLGMMAFKAYQAWQQQQDSAPQQAPRTVDQVPEHEVEHHSHAILLALIAAAKADGTIDADEQKMIETEVRSHTDEPELQQWLNDEVSKPLDIAEVAQAAKGDAAIATEMYLVSVMMMATQGDAERDYLDNLAGELNIDPQLQVQLEQQAKSPAA